MKRRVPAWIYLHAFFCMTIANGLFAALQLRTPLNFMYLAICVCLFSLTGRRVRGILKAGPYEPADGELRDRIKKRIGNLLYLMLYLLTVFLINLDLAFWDTQGKPAEIFTAVHSPFTWMADVGFFLYAAVLLLRAICDTPERQAVWTYTLRRVGIAALLWLFYLVAGLVIGVRFFYGTFAVASVVYLAYALVCNFVLRRQIVTVNFQWKHRYTAVIACALIVVAAVGYMWRDTYYLQGYINQLPRLQQNTMPITYRESDGVYELHMEKDDFKILQLTDIHLGGSLASIRKDKKALEAVYREIAYTKPDLVIVTGDLTFPLGIMSLSLNNASPVLQFAAMMRNLNIPWAFTFGNHDTEAVASMDESSLCALYRSLSFKTSGTLLYPYVQPQITGRNNQLLELYNPDGTLNQALFLLDSNAYTGEGINDYDFIHDDQVDWYARQVERLNQMAGGTVASMAFFHIPLQEYRDAYELYEAGSDEVTYYFGANDEETIDKVCCSDYPSALFDKMVALGSTKALFCGHDHYNNMSLGYRGIRLTYGMSIDYLAMPGIEKSEKQRGGTLITIHRDASFEIEQVPLNQIPDTVGK